VSNGVGDGDGDGGDGDANGDGDGNCDANANGDGDGDGGDVNVITFLATLFFANVLFVTGILRENSNAVACFERNLLFADKRALVGSFLLENNVGIAFGEFLINFVKLLHM